MTRTAISPRLAISTLENTPYSDPVDVVRARSALVGNRFSRIEWLDETGSTNSDLAERARSAGPEQVLGARHQTAGRGRLGRTWVAPVDASILCSALVRSSLGLSESHLITTALGLSARAACASVAGVTPGLKWPNDLVLPHDDGSDRKLAGILAESVTVSGEPPVIVVGIGLNVKWPSALPDELVSIATALNHHTSEPVDPTELVVALLDDFAGRLNLVEDRGPSSLTEDVRAASATLGRRVRVELPNAILVGTATDITPDGSLVVTDDRGVSRPVSVGDVIHLRSGD